MAVYKSKGIVLRSIRYGEADRIIDLYTQDVGLVSGIAKGIRRTRSRFGGRLEPLSCVEFMAYQGRTLDTVTQAEVLRSFHKIRESLDRLEAAGGMVWSIRALAGGGEPDRRVFNLLYRALDSLEVRPSGFVSLEAAFGLKLSMLAGYAPQLDACMSCGAGPEGSPYFAPSLGGLLCSGCRTESGDAFPIAPKALDRLRTLMGTSIREIREAPYDDGLEKNVRRVVKTHVFAHGPGDSRPADAGAATRRPA